MKACIKALFFCLIIISCKNKTKKLLNADVNVAASEFVEFFDELKLPVTLGDSALNAKFNDSLLIAPQVYTKFFSDSIFKSQYGKEKPKVYAAGRFKNGDEEQYLLLKTKGTSKAYYVVALSSGDDYLASMKLVSDKDLVNNKRATIDKNYVFSLSETIKQKNGSADDVSTVYAFNVDNFMVIMHEGISNEYDLPVLNPIDTFPAKGKFAGTYGRDNRNFLSIRDSKDSTTFMFFINFDKGSESACRAELKGEAKMISKDSAYFSETGDPCELGFKFKGDLVRVTESSCSNHRPNACTFNISYNKVKGSLPKMSERLPEPKAETKPADKKDEKKDDKKKDEKKEEKKEVKKEEPKKEEKKEEPKKENGGGNK
jgi:hypothetical protein